MGLLERISSARLPNEETSSFQGMNFAILPKIYHEMVKDLGLASQSHSKEFERGILFRQTGSGRHDISYLGRLTSLCPRTP
jgi:hypothetical protein